MGFLILIGLIIAWFVLGNPGQQVAGWFWPRDAAPWEKVDAFYYPNRANLNAFEAAYDVGGVDACRTWVYAKAAAFNDPSLERGNHECAVGELGRLGSVKIYRLTVE